MWKVTAGLEIQLLCFNDEAAAAQKIHCGVNITCHIGKLRQIYESDYNMQICMRASTIEMHEAFGQIKGPIRFHREFLIFLLLVRFCIFGAKVC